MSKSNWTLLLIVAGVIVLAIVGARLIYFSAGANAYTPPQRELAQVKLDTAPTIARTEIVDNPATSRGVVLVDFGHQNALFPEELNVLLSKIVSRGFSYEFVLTGGQAEADTLEEEDVPLLVDKLRYAKALILPLPRAEYTDAETAAIENFVAKGGQLLIIGDPTRTVFVDGLNSIASSFGIVYANDYLYSLQASSTDNNYRNVVYSNFNQSPITAGLTNGDKVIFYSGSSISAPGHEIILGDETTHSSISEGGRTTMAAAALTTNDRVLALGDLTFFSEPYSYAESNGKLINNIANFLTQGQRQYRLEDFPYFFDAEVEVVFDNSLVFNSQFDDSVKLKDFLVKNKHTVNFVDTISGNNDVIYVGRFNNTAPVDDYLDAGNIQILDLTAAQQELLVSDEAEEAVEETADEQDKTPVANGTPVADDKDKDFVEGRIQIRGVGELERGGSTLFYLHQQDDRNTLIILSDNPDTNADAFELLLEGDFVDCLASSYIAVCQTEEPNKQQPPSVRSTRINKILVVSDNDGRRRNDAQTGMAEFRDVLSNTYKVDTWVTGDGNGLDLDELQEYDAIIWTTGDYWDDSIGQEDAELLTQYIEAGGNLILSGASIAFDWDHTDFSENILHADYLTFAEQKDIRLILSDHPIARGLEPEQVITFVDPPSGEILEPDVVKHTPNSRVIFQRGPASRQEGAAAVIAYEDDRAKIAYFAFPIYMLPVEARDTIINNTVDWFSRKPLDLPDEDEYEPFESDNLMEEPADEEPPADTGEETPENGEEGEDNGNGEKGNETQES